jgi:hypothetical protein
MFSTYRSWFVALLAGSTLVVACSSTTTGSPDASTAPDSGPLPVRDAAVVDSATADAAPAPDASPIPDSAVPDASAPDGSVQDAAIVDAADAAVSPMVLTSATLTDNGRFPVQHTCDGVNGSPALTWTAGPPGTNGYAVVMKDLTVANQHWTLYDIPASTLSIGAGVPFGYSPGTPAPAGSKHGSVTFAPASFGYLGPCPPANNMDHEYVFTVYALSGATVAGAAMGDTPEVLETKIRAQKVNAGAEASLRSKAKRP